MHSVKVPETELIRDPGTNALINNDVAKLGAYRSQREQQRRFMELERKVNEFHKIVSEIRALLKEKTDVKISS